MISDLGNGRCNDGIVLIEYQSAAIIKRGDL